MLIGVTPAIRKIAGQRDDHRRAADDERHAGRDHRAEHEQQRERRERQRDQLAPLEVRLGHLLDVAVERRAAGQPDLDPAPRGCAAAEARQRVAASRRRAGRAGRCRTRCARPPRPAGSRARAG